MSTVKINYSQDHHFAYDVALSFAEESRGFVSRVANQLKKRGLHIYYDDDERVNSWGCDLRESLDRVYLNEARFCVIFISEHYKLKHWTQYEQERAKARAFFTDNEAYILPFRLDDTDISGITDTIAYLSLQTHDEIKLADAIWLKVNKGQRNRWPVLNHSRFFSPKQLRLALITLTVFSSLIIGLTIIKNSDKFTPAHTLIGGMQKRNKLLFRAVCKDGWLSSSRGQGTCSGHGGVDHYVDTLVYDKAVD